MCLFVFVSAYCVSACVRVCLYVMSRACVSLCVCVCTHLYFWSSFAAMLFFKVVMLTVNLNVIGYFDLDPNRVFDVVLDAYEAHPENRNYTRLLNVFNRDFLPHVLGFKFQQYPV